ncbi:chromate efflux transporter [Paractinoplanes brasiliensis]|uniref:Chromate transporter n=1 Tax=Paractinoplanes brasiliensis TaxID=52695 RepID=A0A4R6JV30_9ACTN|nr:chromate efflux transporter [Actinoplanes brasiliensis]TDO39702.1 chromate transporter [Actinoplanes brasiliensis]GID28961.1 chromate transporter [Actinoplanes brasiliensis]
MTAPEVRLTTVLREWGRIGCVGFGGPPAHIALLRKLCVEDRKWLDAQEFEDAIAACNLLPGPASTQLAIFTAWRVRGRPGAVVGGLAFILPGLIAILGLAMLFLGDPPLWVEAAGAGAGAAVAAVAVQAGWSLVPPGWQRTPSRRRWIAYLLLGAVGAATVGAWLVLLLIACGVVEAVFQRVPASRPPLGAFPLIASAGLAGSITWVALKVGALSYGGGFVIIPLMQADAVDRYHWMTSAEFLNAVALGQITPGPVVHTVAVVGYAAAALPGALLAAAVAFGPSFAFILLGAHRFDRLRSDQRVRAFLDGAGPAAIGAILGSAVPLTLALSEVWQLVVLAGALVLMLALRRGPVLTLLSAAAVGVTVVLLGGPLPS